MENNAALSFANVKYPELLPKFFKCQKQKENVEIK